MPVLLVIAAIVVGALLLRPDQQTLTPAPGHLDWLPIALFVILIIAVLIGTR